MPTDAAVNLVELLQRHRLLEPEHLAALTDLQKEFPEPRGLAKELVARRWLTTYQANQLVAGHVQNLRLGPYVLLEKVGEGGMGQVFKARHQRFGRIDAVKIIRKERLEKADAIKRFYREIRAASALKHPNIVHAYDAGEVEGTHYFSMEYVDGTDLAAVVKQRGPLSVAEACDYIRQAALGLQHAFERGLVHRDIKPHNLLLSVVRGPLSAARTAGSSSHGPRTTDHGQVKILDLGLARLESASADDKSSTMTHEGTVMGTPDYMAPEQTIDSHNVDIRADLYSLGCTLYFLLTGRAPFPGGSLGEKLVKHQLYEPEAIAKFRGDVPSEVVEIVQRLMRKKPEERYQTPVELVEGLAALSDRLLAMGQSDPGAHTESFLADSHLGDSRAATDDSRQDETPPLIEQLRQKRLASQKRFEKRFLLGGGIGVGVLIIGFALFLIIRGLDKEPTQPADATKNGQDPRPVVPKPGRPPTPAEQEREFQAKRTAEAEAAYSAFEAKFKALGEPGGVCPRSFESFEKEFATFRAKHGGTPAALKAAARLMELPSLLDQLDPKKLPEDCLAAWRAAGREPPGELVGVLGEHRGRHWGGITAVLVSQSTQRIVSLSRSHQPGDGTVRIWEASNLNQLRAIEQQPHGLGAIGLSPNGRILAIAPHDDRDTGVQIWDLATMNRLGILEAVPTKDQPVVSLTTSPNGKLLAAATYGSQAERKASLFVWDLTTQKLKLTKPYDIGWPGPHPLAFTPDSTTLAIAVTSRVDLQDTGGQNAEVCIKLFDVETGQDRELARWGATYQAQKAALKYMPDGRTLVFGYFVSPIMLIDAVTGKTERSLEQRGWFALSGDGTTLVTGEGLVVDVASGTVRHRLTAQGVPAISSDGRTAAIGTADGTVRLWNVDTGKEVQPLTGPVGKLNSAHLLPDSHRLATAGADKRGRLWDAVRGEVLCEYEAEVTLPLLDGSGLLAGNPSRLVDLAGKERLQFKGYSWAPTLDSEQLLTVEFEDKTPLALLRTDLRSGKELNRWPLPIKNWLHHEVHPDGRRLVMVWDDVIHVWDLQRGQELTQFRVGEPVSWMRCLPDGQFLTVTEKHEALFWDLQTSAPVRRISMPSVHYVDFSPDGKTFVGWGKNPGWLGLWDVASGVKLQEWQLPGPFQLAPFAPDGRHLVTANGNGTVYILRIAKPPTSDGVLEFDGKTSYVRIPSLHLEPDRPYTVEAWVKYDAPTSERFYVVASAFNPACGASLFRWPQGHTHFGARTGRRQQFEGEPQPTGKTGWMHVAGVWDGKAARMYLDGKRQPHIMDDERPEEFVKAQNQPWILGGELAVPGQAVTSLFAGLMDEVRISKVARYDGDFTPSKRHQPDKDTLALYHCDNGQGDVLKDSSGNNHHGKIVGAKWVKAAPVADAPGSR